MSSVVRGVRAFVMFWVKFIIGDDWTVAATVALALLGTWGLTRAGVVAWWLLPLAVLAVTAVSLRRAVEREVRQDQPGYHGSSRPGEGCSLAGVIRSSHR
jgi:hypothetical protein